MKSNPNQDSGKNSLSESEILRYKSSILSYLAKIPVLRQLSEQYKKTEGTELRIIPDQMQYEHFRGGRTEADLPANTYFFSLRPSNLIVEMCNLDARLGASTMSIKESDFKSRLQNYLLSKYLNETSDYYRDSPRNKNAMLPDIYLPGPKKFSFTDISALNHMDYTDPLIQQFILPDMNKGVIIRKRYSHTMADLVDALSIAYEELDTFDDTQENLDAIHAIVEGAYSKIIDKMIRFTSQLYTENNRVPEDKALHKNSANHYDYISPILNRILTQVDKQIVNQWIRKVNETDFNNALRGIADHFRDKKRMYLKKSLVLKDIYSGHALLELKGDLNNGSFQETIMNYVKKEGTIYTDIIEDVRLLDPKLVYGSHGEMLGSLFADQKFRGMFRPALRSNFLMLIDYFGEKLKTGPPMREMLEKIIEATSPLAVDSVHEGYKRELREDVETSTLIELIRVLDQIDKLNQYAVYQAIDDIAIFGLAHKTSDIHLIYQSLSDLFPRSSKIGQPETLTKTPKKKKKLFGKDM